MILHTCILSHAKDQTSIDAFNQHQLNAKAMILFLTKIFNLLKNTKVSLLRFNFGENGPIHSSDIFNIKKNVILG